MTSGTLSFTVDGTTCPDTNGVGVSAVGGAFNCKLTGTTFKVECIDECDAFVIVQLSLWKDKIMTLDGTPYYLADGHDCKEYLGSPLYNFVNKVFNVGSYWYGAATW